MRTLFPSLALSSKEASAMSFYELSAPRTAQTAGIFARVGQTLSKALKACQYGRMLQVMSLLTNEQLETMGIKRSDIPNVAHKVVYED